MSLPSCLFLQQSFKDPFLQTCICDNMHINATYQSEGDIPKPYLNVSVKVKEVGIYRHIYIYIRELLTNTILAVRMPTMPFMSMPEPLIMLCLPSVWVGQTRNPPDISIICMGRSDQKSPDISIICIGQSDKKSPDISTICMGQSDQKSPDIPTICMGRSDQKSPDISTIYMGRSDQKSPDMLASFLGIYWSFSYQAIPRASLVGI